MADSLLLRDYVDRERDRIVSTLLDWLRVPSISAQPEHAGDVQTSAEFAADRLTEAGFEHVEILPTDGHPAVYGDWLHAGPNAPTVLVYGHHDVQPVDPLDEWRSPPVGPGVVRGGGPAPGGPPPKGPGVCEIEGGRAPPPGGGAPPGDPPFLL